MKCPCEECLTKAVCRHKGYHTLIYMCEPLAKFLNLREGREDGEAIEQAKKHKENLFKFQEVIKPTGWRVGKQTRWGYQIR